MLVAKIKPLIHYVQNRFKPPVIRNCFGRDYSKKVLISYVTYPFFKSIDDKSHTNFQESHAIAKVFDELGFSVDIVDYFYEGKINYDEYDVIFGFEKPFENYFYTQKNNLVSIFYGTGRHPYMSGPASLKRISEVYRKKGVRLLESARIVKNDYAIQTILPDAIFSLGNQYCADSWQMFSNNRVYPIPASFYQECDYKKIVSGKNFDVSKSNYLWMGASGLIHKGLDLVLEAFSLMPDLQLYICGELNESGFVASYKKELELPNIHRMGFVNVGSDEFQKIMSKCAFVIYPSCSEGGGPPVVSAMGNGGLIPIISREVTVDIGESGFLLTDLSVNSIRQTVQETQKMKPSELKKRSLAAAKISNENNSLKTFSKRLKVALSDVLNKHDLNI